MKKLFQKLRGKTDSEQDSDTESSRLARKPVEGRHQPALKGYMNSPKQARKIAEPEEDHTKTVLDILDNPDLELQPDGFDPYNSGSFDRSNEWSRVKKHN